jgi:DNA-directed RNA polymerase specialized sigma24 family protein
MPHKGSSLRTLDLFEHAVTVTTSRSEPASAAAKPSQATGLSDAQLAEGLAEFLYELQRRMEAGRGRRPELEQAMSHARRVLERLGPKIRRSERRQQTVKSSSSLQEGQRKAVRAALLAGVAPGQVAKHFGLSLAAVRKVLEEAA